jgi:hypothetical protein
MRAFAGTFHRNKKGDWVKCVTEGGRPCSRHCGGEHIKGANLEEALKNLHADDEFGLSSVDSSVEPTGNVIHHDEHATLDSVRGTMFPGVPSSNDLTDGLQRQFDEMWDGLTPEARDDISFYTLDGFEDINDYLRASDAHERHRMEDTYNDVFHESLESKVDNIHEAISNVRTKRDMVVYRCRFVGKDDSINGLLLNGRSGEEKACYDALSDDGVFMKTNFGSTTTDGGGMKDNWHLSDRSTQYVIKVPKGSPGIYVESMSNVKGEREFLMDCNTKYRVVGIYERGHLNDGPDDDNWDKAPIVALEVVND